MVKLVIWFIIIIMMFVVVIFIVVIVIVIVAAGCYSQYRRRHLYCFRSPYLWSWSRAHVQSLPPKYMFLYTFSKLKELWYLILAKKFMILRKLSFEPMLLHHTVLDIALCQQNR